MRRSNRRTILTLGAASAAALGTGMMYRAGRFEAPVPRNPDLTEAHLSRITSVARSTDRPRILLIGNSATISSGFLQHLSSEVAETAYLARASANGARLVQSLRIASLRTLTRAIRWDVLVLQDFSSTPLHPADRLASRLAISRFATLAAPAHVVLFPHWPSAPGHVVYRGGLGAGYAVPEDLEEYAARSQAHYRQCARRVDGTLAPVLPAWVAALAQGEQLYQRDGHHASAAGAALAAKTLWPAIRAALS
ncbi:MAG: hypothetical protein AAF678_10005 [Pseudomonadota bacterium]